MKKLISLLFIAALLPLLTLTSCREPEPETKADYTVLTEYVTSNSLDLSDILTGWVKPGSALTISDTDYAIADYYIMDFRKAADFNTGHIKAAHNVAFANLLTAAPTDKNTKILCVCYTGQTAARATGFLRLAGYKNAATLKWGMAAWHQDFQAKWETNAVDYASPNWVETGTPVANATFSDPTFSTGKTEGADILNARIQTAMGFEWTISKTDVLGTPSDYFINNKWPQVSWDEYGHIKDAYRINEDLLISGLKNLNPDEKIVTYCYTGQTSAITTAWLQVMGFDKAKSLLFGANGIAHTKLVVGAVDGGKKKSWKGEGSASVLNKGYYDSTDTLHPPL
jgi:rhodanese-related sulfurtransferase